MRSVGSYRMASMLCAKERAWSQRRLSEVGQKRDSFEGTHISAGKLYRDKVRFMGTIGACTPTFAGLARLAGEFLRRVGVESDEDGRGS